MIKEVLEYVKKNGMLCDRDKVVLGVSGGADSVCLFFVMLELKSIYHLELYVVHVNHGIRGEEAREDAVYVENLCQQHRIPYFLVEEDILEKVRRERISEEEAGRNARYQAFERVCQEYGADKIAVAHNQNDSGETLLFNLFRGSGLRGLRGIPPVRDRIIRPLLEVNRQKIEEFLEEREIPYQTDQTNETTDYTRNRIRLEMIPYIISHINSNAVEHMAKTGVMIEETLAYIEGNTQTSFSRLMKQQGDVYFCSVEEFLKEDIVIQKQLIRMTIRKMAGRLKNITSNHIDAVLELLHNQVGKRIDLPYSIVVQKGYHEIRFERNNLMENNKDEKVILGFEYHNIDIPGKLYISQTNQKIEFQLFSYKKNLRIPQNGCTKWFDYDKIDSTVVIRTRKEGDFFWIHPKGGKKKLKSYYIDKKIPKEMRDSIPLLADGNHIMWIMGDRISEAYKIDKNTKNILMVKIYGGYQDESQD